MEQEPVYVISDKLNKVCERVLTEIYTRRQDEKEAYVLSRVQAYNQAAYKSNKWRSKFGWLGVKPQDYITPYGMEMLIKDEIDAMPEDDQVNHQMIRIHQQYGGLEHEAKDCMIQCKLNETVAVSSNMTRGISHLGISLDFMAKPRFGFVANR